MLSYWIMTGVNNSLPLPADFIIINRIYTVTGYTIDDLRGESRKEELVLVRHYCMFLLRKKARLIWKQIGVMLNRDHSTAMHGYNKICNLFDSKDRKLHELIERYHNLKMNESSTTASHRP